MSTVIMPTEELRERFRTLRRNAGIAASYDEWFEEVQNLLADNDDPTPDEWVAAAEAATVKCGRCQGTGVYRWGAVINGRSTHQGACYQCEGKGRQGQADFKRNFF